MYIHKSNPLAAGELLIDNAWPELWYITTKCWVKGFFDNLFRCQHAKICSSLHHTIHPNNVETTAGSGVNNASKININAINLNVRARERDMMLWNSDRDEKLLQSLSRPPDRSRVQRYYYFWVSVYARIHWHDCTWTHTHTGTYNRQPCCRGRARDDWLMPSSSHPRIPFTPLPLHTSRPIGRLWLMAVKRAFPGKYYTTTSTIVPWYWLSFHFHMFHKVCTLSTVLETKRKKNINSIYIYIYKHIHW